MYDSKSAETAGIGKDSRSRLRFYAFSGLAILGIAQIFQYPQVFYAINPFHGVQFFITNGWHGFIILGSVFLVVTAGEALYADMGHFGRKPIRLACFAVVLPALLLKYFGQGALLLEDPAMAVNPLYNLAPAWALYPMDYSRNLRGDHRFAGFDLRCVFADDASRTGSDLFRV